MKTSSSTLTIGRKIGLGFTLILLILTLAGGYAVLTMRSSADKAEALATDYVPEFSLASQAAIDLGNAMLATRSYGLTGQQSYLDAARKELVNVDAHVKELEALAERTTRLQLLKTEIKDIRTAHNNYVQALDETETAQKSYDKIRAEAGLAAADVTRTISSFIDSQEKSLVDEIEKGVSHEKLAERAEKVALSNNVIELMNAVRIANWQSQASRDQEILRKKLSNFDLIKTELDKLAPLVHLAENKRQLDEISKNLKIYSEAMTEQMRFQDLLAKVMERRNAAAAILQDACEKVTAAASKHTNEIANDTQSTLTRTSSLMLVGVLLAIGIGITVAFFITRAITVPLAEAVRFVEKVANRDLTVSIETHSHDEIGQICEALNDMVKGLRANIQQIAQNSQSLSASSEELSAVSSQVSSAAEETASQANIVSAAAEQVSKNVGTVATGTEEMSASIREIAKNASEAAKVASHAATVAERTNVTVSKLGDSSIEIGNVIKVITSIAEQTNLLALNATIEAARAGEAGKGFAVVANEVKELAKQTAKATEEIGSKIKGIQGDTQGAVEAIKEISAIIGQINLIQTIIASSVEEQAATTNEISKNVSEAATGANEIAKNIGSVSTAAKGTTEGATQTSTAAHELARLSSDLKQVVDNFKIDSAGSATVSSGRHSPRKG